MESQMSSNRRPLSYSNLTKQNITKTFQCNVYSLEPHFSNSKTGVYRGTSPPIPNYLILLQNIDRGYSLEPLRLAEAVQTCAHNLCFSPRGESLNIIEFKHKNMYSMSCMYIYMQL